MAVINNSYVTPPRKPTWARYKKLIQSPHTLYRSLEYEILGAEKFTGKVLDVGGGQTSYRPVLHIDGTYDSVNASREMEPTHVADLNTGIPIDDNHYDAVISLNTLEHIYKIDFAVDEIVRVAKPGGKILIGVPFLFRVHGSPDDFHRKTASWWAQRLLEAGCSGQSIAIEPIMWDIPSVGFSITERVRVPLVPYRLRRAWRLLPGVVLSSYGGSDGRIPQEKTASWQDFALGYVIRAHKAV